MYEPKNTCFVIMPFGEKKDVGGRMINFDKIYEEIIKEPIRSAGLEPLRCDEIQEAGSIHKDMFEHIAQDRVAVVDLTTLNANVFYELGVRHALKNNVTVLIQAEGSNIPFNIRGLRIIMYPANIKDFAETRTRITNFIINGLNNQESDSPVKEIMAGLKVKDKSAPIQDLKHFSYQIKDASKRGITLLTGDIISRTEDIDVWVNSENTNMQMARYFDKSLSASVRYHGAKKDENEEIIEDTIANQLAAAKGKRETVNPFTVLVTDGGDLMKTHGVKKIFHVAATFGIPGIGWTAVPQIHTVVTKCLRMTDTRKEELTSIVFPLLGTGRGGLDVYELAPLLIRQILNYFKSRPESKVQNVYIMAWNWRDLEACQNALENITEIKKI